MNDSSSNTIFGYAETGVKSWCYVYPFGSTITIAKPSVTALASGNECFPANRPLCAGKNQLGDFLENKPLSIFKLLFFFSLYESEYKWKIGGFGIWTNAD